MVTKELIAQQQQQPFAQQQQPFAQHQQQPLDMQQQQHFAQQQQPLAQHQQSLHSISSLGTAAAAIM